MQNEEIVFELLVPYSQEHNGISEKMESTLMNITRATILEGNIKDELWPKLVLAMTYIKNSHSTKVLANNFSSHKAHIYKKLDFSYL